MTTNSALISPVVFAIFNRPDTTARVFQEIRKAQPKRLYVIADGPRLDKRDDETKCEGARAVLEGVDWDCEVFKNFSDVNLGCGRRISSGFDWVFEQEEAAIILEDDCLPSQSFFSFCQEMLLQYKSDTRIMHVNGSNFNEERNLNNDSYFFSRYNHVWGWATWRRAWKYYDYDMKMWPTFRAEMRMSDVTDNPKEIKYWSAFLDACHGKRIVSTWDYQWTFAIWSNNGLCVTPRKNLVSNIGFAGTHSDHLFTEHFNRPVDNEFKFDSPPAFTVRNDRFDRYHFAHHFYISLTKRIKKRFARILTFGR